LSNLSREHESRTERTTALTKEKKKEQALKKAEQAERNREKKIGRVKKNVLLQC
jgi:hypothetical protein